MQRLWVHVLVGMKTFDNFRQGRKNPAVGRVSCLLSKGNLFATISKLKSNKKEIFCLICLLSGPRNDDGKRACNRLQSRNNRITNRRQYPFMEH